MLNSLRKNKVGIMLAVCSSLCTCTGQLLWKLSADKGAIMIFAGFIVYGIAALVMLFAYRFGSLSVLQPILSSSYVFSSIVAVTILNESMTFPKFAGIIIIIISVILIGSSDK